MNLDIDPTGPSFKAYADYLRSRILQTGERVRELMNSEDLTNINIDAGEIRANLLLAYRHLEDSRMRLGKALQAFDGGVSCYDRDEAKEAQQKNKDYCAETDTVGGHLKAAPFVHPPTKVAAAHRRVRP